MVRKLNGQNHANGNGNARVTDGPHTGDWLCVHRRHETPAVGRAILDFSRVANREHFMGRLLPFLRSYGERVSIGRNETITRKDLFELEKLVMQDDYGLESAILHVAPRNPYLAEVLGDPKAYTEFVENHVQVKKWKESLRTMGKTKNESLRAVSMLLFLRTAHKGKANGKN